MNDPLWATVCCFSVINSLPPVYAFIPHCSRRHDTQLPTAISSHSHRSLVPPPPPASAPPPPPPFPTFLWISPRSIGPLRHFKRPFTKTIGSHSEDLITSPSALFTHHPVSSFSRAISAAALLYHPIRECLSAIPAMRTSRSKLGLRVRAQEHCRHHTDGTC